MSKNRGLGKGLGALLPELEEENLKAQSHININLIVPNPYQPRKEFSDEKLSELAESIKVHGIIQPLLVREINGQYQLIAGERRLRAAKLAGLDEVPVVIKDLTDQSMMEIALVENIQRENLNPIEEAEAYRRLMNEFNFTQDDIAKKVGKSRPAIANILRLLNLPQEIQHDLSNGTLTMGHARALLGLKTQDDQKEVWHQIQAEGLSVRETEELIRKLNEEPVVSRETKKVKTVAVLTKDPNVMEMEDELQQVLGTKVTIKPHGMGGRIEIEYYSPDEFERICEKFLRD
ncbi:MAG TPA: ParB/RepB/Spo0J family partition protein [Bacillota bacterium]|nr:ParB/RepB/Spo0J family partition protein [Bacillota bacterium]HPT86347.1 ParB/RepB/Spo0J family partition protein [Bacillota bacterium]